MAKRIEIIFDRFFMLFPFKLFWVLNSNFVLTVCMKNKSRDCSQISFSLRYLLTRRANVGKPTPQFTQRTPPFGPLAGGGPGSAFRESECFSLGNHFSSVGSTQPTGKEPVNRLW